MDAIIKFYTQARKNNMTACAAIRATTQEFIDVPRVELIKVLVEACKLNPATCRTQVQIARKSLGIVDMPAAKSAPAAQPVKPAAKKVRVGPAVLGVFADKPAAAAKPAKKAAAK
jgi:hypothetical protein